MPSAEKSAASSGMEMTPAQKRGATTRAMGSTAIISIADSCSVAFINPISAVIARAARLHQPALARDRPARAAREQQTGDHGPELAHERKRHQDAERLGRAVA